jgi:rhamnose utilization protein RhaD (predicted bifunctional aldolase and dehydrogenase)
MHAVLAHRCVIHVHSVNTLAWAVRADAPAQLSAKLSGLAWAWIPYVPSGAALAREVELAYSACPGTEIFILGNHGLVVCGENCDAAESVLAEVQRRLATPLRPAARPKLNILERIQRISRWRLPDSEALHSLGTNPASRRIVHGGVLYPCQAIFLGRTLTLLPAPKNLSDLTKGIDHVDASAPFLVVEGSGVLINDRITAAQNAVLNGFAEVVRRIDVSAPIRYLSDPELNYVLNADAHRYKMSAETNAGRV